MNYLGSHCDQKGDDFGCNYISDLEIGLIINDLHCNFLLHPYHFIAQLNHGKTARCLLIKI